MSSSSKDSLTIEVNPTGHLDVTLITKGVAAVHYVTDEVVNDANRHGLRMTLRRQKINIYVSQSKWRL